MAAVDAALAQAGIGSGAPPRVGQLPLVATVATGVLTVAVLMFLLWSNARLTTAVADRNATVDDVRRVLNEVSVSEDRAQCFFDLIARNSLEPDPQVRHRDAVDYVEGRLCPRADGAGVPLPVPAP